jgi:hypothetical protein
MNHIIKLFECKDQFGRTFTQRVERFNIKNKKISNVSFLTYNHKLPDKTITHSLKDISYIINSFVGGYTKKNKEINKIRVKKQKREYTKKNRKINKK